MSTWNRKYRPTTIGGLHLNVVRDQLSALIAAGSLPQVFVFAGPKGTGKTSTARILGALVNNPANEAQIKRLFFKEAGEKKPLLDNNANDQLNEEIFQGNSYIVQEMDAASNRGIDDVRSLKERVSLPPSFGLMSVYILDEAHMLTTEAFNALLKLLEEPPSHAMFILATTEIQKIPDTIISRAQVIAFQKASDDEIAQALIAVLKKEAITYEDNAIMSIATQADGSFRDAIKLLEAIAQTGSVTLERVEATGTLSYDKQLIDLIEAIVAKDIEKIVSIFVTARNSNVQEAHFHKLLLKLLHDSLQKDLQLISGKPLVSFEIARFLLFELSSANLSEQSPIPLLQLEMKILDIVARSKKKSSPSNDSTPPKSGGTPTVKKKLVAEQQTIQILQATEIKVPTPAIFTPIDTTEPLQTIVKEQTDYNQKADGAELLRNWTVFLDKLAVQNATVAALLRSAHPIEGSAGQITVKVFYKFHQEQLRATRFNQMIRSCAEEMLTGSLEFNFIVEEPIVATDLNDVRDLGDLSSIASQALM